MATRILGLLGVLLGAALTLSGSASFAQKDNDKAPSTIGDRNGDPLPRGALARMGTLRWRHSEAVTFLAYLTDGKRVLTGSQDGALQLWERETGKRLLDYKMPPPPKANLPQPGQPAVAMVYMGRGGPSAVALSPDGKTLAASNANAIQLWDVDSGKQLQQHKSPTANVLTTLLFSPDGKTLAARGYDRNISLVDVETGKENRKIVIPANNNRVFIAGQGILETVGLVFSNDGKTIASSEAEFVQQKAIGFVRISSVETGEQVRKIETPAGSSSLAYSPDGKVLAQAGANAIYLRDAESGKEIRKLDAPGGTATLAFSKDGKVLANKGRDNVVRLWNAESGAVLQQLGEGLPAQAANVAITRFPGYTEPRDLAIAPDGVHVAVGGAKSPRFWFVATGKEQQAAGGHRGTVNAVVITPDGKTLLSHAADNTVRRWDTATGEELSQFTTPSGTTGAAFSADGKTVALANADGTIRLCDAVTGKERHKANGHPNSTAVLFFSTDGKTLVSRGSFDGTIRLTDTAHGSELRQIALNPNAGTGRVGGGFGGFGMNGMGLALSRDGRTLAAIVTNMGAPIMIGNPAPRPQAPSNTVRLWDVASGREIRKMELPSQRGTGTLAFSPDGRLLAMENADQTTSVLELLSGKERMKLGEPGGVGPAATTWQSGFVVLNNGFATAPGLSPTLAFSPDGALLATKGPDHSISVWQIATGKDIGDFNRHNGHVAVLAFAPDGKSIASGSHDTTVLTWNAAHLKRGPTFKQSDLNAEEVAALWNDLAGDDAAKAYSAICALAGSATKSLPLFRAKLQPAEAVDAKVLNQLLADLDSEKFAARNKAKEELERLGDLAVPALQKLLDSEPSLETRRRIEPLLAKQAGGILTSEQIRLVRALEALEMLGTPDARALLTTLAKGAEGALTTRQAKAGLDRLEKLER